MDSGPVARARLAPATARAPAPARARRPVFGLYWLNEDWRPSPVRDVITAVILTVITVYASYGEAHPAVPGNYFTGSHHLPYTPDAAFLLPVASGLVLALRHRYPRLVLCASTAAAVAYSVAGWENGGIVLMPAVALGTLAAMVPARSAIAWGVGLLVVLTLASVVSNPLGTFGGGVIVLPGTLAVALLAGIAIRNRRAYSGSVRRQAERDVQHRIDEERLRIARELHDVVAHTMATITVQAAAASQLLPTSPERAAESLAAIRAASKEGLRELHAILDVMRNAGDPPDSTTPVPGLARLGALAEGVGRSGVPVTVTVAGQPRQLPAVTDLSAFRIIQEALTNTVRHAGASSASVAVRYGPADLHIEISDNGQGSLTGGSVTGGSATGASPTGGGITGSGVTGSGVTGGGVTGGGVTGSSVIGASATASEDGRPPLPSPGHGLLGMRERAAAAGGTIEIGPLPSGGFRVAARLPAPPDPIHPIPSPSGSTLPPGTPTLSSSSAPFSTPPTGDSPISPGSRVPSRISPTRSAPGTASTPPPPGTSPTQNSPTTSGTEAG
ncbi:MAG TPA: sensor histidine kinase [Trebonia sp.]|nr:sensor histidine kinase [Trebonia sp.]